MTVYLGKAGEGEILATLKTLEEMGAYCSIRDNVWHWHGVDTGYYPNREWSEDPADAPAPGERGSDLCSGYSYGSKCYHEHIVEYVVISSASWGDYDNSGTYHRSNYRALLRDFPDHVIELRETWWQGLAIRVGSVIPEELAEALAEIHEYPVYDEQDLSDLEMELEREDWESWARSDFKSEIDDAARKDGDDEFEASERWTDEQIDDLMWSAMSDGKVHWYGETAVSGYFDGMRDYAKDVYADAKQDDAQELEDHARAMTAEQYVGMDVLPGV